jgi:hypothetical protein
MHLLARLGCLLVALALAPAAASAAIDTKVTYVGRVFDGLDQNGAFSSDATFANDLMTFAFFFDSAGPGAFIENSNPQRLEMYGGPLVPGTTFPGYAQISYAGVTYRIDPLTSGSAARTKIDDDFHFASNAIVGGAQPGFPANAVEAYLSAPPGTMTSIALGSPYHYEVPFNDPVWVPGLGSFSIYAGQTAGGLDRFASGSVQTLSITVEAIPESPTWIMMTIALAALGGALRKARSASKFQRAVV